MAAPAQRADFPLHLRRQPGRAVRQRLLPLDEPLRDIARDRGGDLIGFMGFRHDRAAVAAVLDEAVHALVAAHGDMGHHVDPQARRIAPADAALEQLDVVRDICEQRIERFVEQFEPRQFGVAQVDHNGIALGALDAGLAHRLPQPGRIPLLGLRHGLTLSAPHG
jgi:hypothetical protein